MSRQHGFSLIELLIVVAIILIIAAIAIPNLLRSKAAANEAAAANSMAQVAQSNILYVSTYSLGYAGSIAQLGPPQRRLCSGEFRVRRSAGRCFIRGQPRQPNSTEKRLSVYLLCSQCHSHQRHSEWRLRGGRHASRGGRQRDEHLL